METTKQMEPWKPIENELGNIKRAECEFAFSPMQHGAEAITKYWLWAEKLDKLFDPFDDSAYSVMDAINYFTDILSTTEKRWKNDEWIDTRWLHWPFAEVIRIAETTLDDLEEGLY